MIEKFRNPVDRTARIRGIAGDINRLTFDLDKLAEELRECSDNTQDAIIRLTGEREKNKKFEQGYKRYELLRTFNVPQFARLLEVNIKQNIPFDALVDNLIMVRDTNKTIEDAIKELG